MPFGSYFLGFDKEVFTEELKIGINEVETHANLDLCSSRENKLQFSEPLKKEKFFKSHRTEQFSVSHRLTRHVMDRRHVPGFLLAAPPPPLFTFLCL